MLHATVQYTFEPGRVPAPGETLRETMKALSMGRHELAIRTGLPVQTLNGIFMGEQPICRDIAHRLELAVGVPATMWNNLEARYREQLAKKSQASRTMNVSSGYNLDAGNSIPRNACTIRPANRT